MLHEYDEIDPIILSTGAESEVSIKQVADAIVNAMDFHGDFQVSPIGFPNSICNLPVFSQMDPSKADGQYRKTASNSKLTAQIPNFQFTPFEEGQRNFALEAEHGS